MSLTPAVHVLLLAVSVLTTAGLAGYSWRHRRRQGALLFCGLMVSFTLYSLGHLVGLLTLHPDWRLVWEYVQWTGGALGPLFWLLFAIVFTGYGDRLDRRTVGVLSAGPALTVVLAWTNPLHGLVWDPGATVAVTNGLAIMRQSFGPWFPVYTATTYAMVGAGSVLFLRLIWLSDRLYTSQVLLLVTGLVTPIVGSVLTLLRVSPIRDPLLDIAPYGLSVTGLAFGYALFRSGLFDIAPAAHQLGRNAAIRDLNDGVIIVGIDRRIAYCNGASTELLDRDPADLIGEPVDPVLEGPAPESSDEPVEIQRGDGVYEVRASPIRGRRDRLLGYTLIIQEVTARKRREQRLTRQREELERLDDLNSLIRGVNQALLSPTSREGIEQAVCERLAESDRYRIACIADIPTWEGDGDRWTVAGAEGTASALPPTIREEGLDIEEDATSVAADTPEPPGTWTIVPVVYGRTVYGALGLCSRPEGDGPTEREREVLTELGELIGHAINAVETRQLLAAESVVELEFRSRDGTLLGAATAADCRLEVTGLVPDAGEGHLAYVRVDGGSPATVAAELAEAGETAPRTVREGEDGGLVEWTVPEDSTIGTLIADGGHLLEATAAGETAEYRVEVASDADVRTVLDRVERAFPGTALTAKHEHDRPIDPADTVPGDAVEELTDRQQEALEAAYRAGYYDWPRESTAEDLADTLDIAAPTLHAHLRKAESRLLADLFESDGGLRSDGS